MRALEKDPGRASRAPTAFIAALDAALRDPGAAGGGTVAFAPLPPVVAPPQEAAAAGDERERQRRWRRRWLAVLAAVLIGVLAGIALTRDTTTSVPERDRPAAPTSRSPCWNRTASRSAR